MWQGKRVVNALQLISLTISLEQREIDHPKEAEVIRLLYFGIFHQKVLIVQSDATQQFAL